MAKKGGAQQLQADINTDEEFEKFLDRPGLLVLDVYSEWCGPCLGMVGSLKKIKLELGGDNLQLAICKADTISSLKRFQKKSEPTWLFVVKGKAVNLMFGTNVPQLMKLIATELSLLTSKEERVRYDITELQPEEVERRKVKEDALAEAENIERNEREKKRTEYLTFVTDTIMENLQDMGVTVFGPHINRDMFKKITEPADELKIQCKDRKTVMVTKEDFDVVNFACNNPLTNDVIEQLDQKELLMCFWKIPDESNRTVSEVLSTYAHDLTKTRTEPPDDFNEEERVIPPILVPLEVMIEIEVQDGEEYSEDNELDEGTRKSHKSHKSLGAVSEFSVEMFEEGDEEEDIREAEGQGDEVQQPEMPELGLDLDLDLGLDQISESESKVEEVTADVTLDEPVKSQLRKKKITIPPIWVPNNQRTHAALIYVFFRAQTGPFLPPDPVPEPPHVVMAFDAYKKKDLISLAERNKDDVPLYGFFTSDDADDAQFIANSAQKYATQMHTPTDKLVFKVCKQTSHTMLSLATYGPSYVSPNTLVGREEALKFFPECYKTAEQELAEQRVLEEQEPKKKRKSKKSRASDVAGAVEEGRASSPQPPASGEEGATTTSGEESGDSMPPSAEGEDEGAAEEAEAEIGPSETVTEATAAAPPKDTA